jgi:hypothetical protein
MARLQTLVSRWQSTYGQHPSNPAESSVSAYGLDARGELLDALYGRIRLFALFAFIARYSVVL